MLLRALLVFRIIIVDDDDDDDNGRNYKSLLI